MPATAYKKPTKRPAKPSHGRAQHQSSAKGVQHKDFTNFSFNAAYGREERPVDLFKQLFRVSARTGGERLDISGLVEQLTWQEESGSDAVVYANSAPPLTGTVQMRKPSLSQYRQLVPPLFDATVNERAGTSRFGALGVRIVCEVGYGKAFTPIWVMRVTPSSSGGSGAEEVDLADGTWTLQLADDLALLGQSVDDFKFTKGKKSRRRGWRCHEIAVAVARQYGVPVARLARGTAWLDVPLKDSTAISPSEMIQYAYQQESYKTGKAYIMRWAAPTKKWPFGALEVVPMRRNPNLIAFRHQLINAVLTRSQRPGYASVITGRATLKGAHGKHKQITYVAKSPTAVKRFGFVHQIVDFHPVSSHLELEFLTKRALAFRLTPVRSAEITNPGIATIRRGDAIRIQIPEEGYADVPLTAYGTPKPPRGSTNRAKYTALALKRAELADPSMFGLPDASILDPTAQNVSLAAAASASLEDTPVLVPVADQSIAFVTAATHSVSSGNYSLDMQTSFVDILDPQELKAEIEANIRNGKSLKRAGSAAVKSGSSATQPIAAVHSLPSGTHGGLRSASSIKLIVLHDSEIACGSGSLNALWNALNDQGLSVHVGIDCGGSLVRFVPDEYECFHCVSFNPVSLGIEQIGFATQTSWPDAQIQSTAAQVAFWSKKFGIPLVFSTSHGVCQHKDLGSAGGGHSDCGPHYPFNRVLQIARGL